MVELVETLKIEHFYSPLLEVDGDDTGMSSAPKFFEHDIFVVPIVNLKVFAKYEEGGFGGDPAADLATLYGVLSQRIQKEELLPCQMYEKP